jgi:hypothetical protein
MQGAFQPIDGARNISRCANTVVLKHLGMTNLGSAGETGTGSEAEKKYIRFVGGVSALSSMQFDRSSKVSNKPGDSK